MNSKLKKEVTGMRLTKAIIQFNYRIAKRLVKQCLELKKNGSEQMSKVYSHIR